MLSIQAATLADAPELLQFELENRGFFERWLAGRGEDFYRLAVVEHMLKKAEIDWLAGRSYQYLIRLDGQIMGRINLIDVKRGSLNQACVGFRIGERFVRRGIASEALEFALFEAFTVHHLWRIEALARPDNTASLKALQKNGFHPFGRATRCIFLNGQWHDLIHFERHADGYTPEITPT